MLGKKKAAEERKAKEVVARLHEKVHGQESTGAEQGCWGLDTADVTHS